MTMPNTFEGAAARLYVDTSAALAQLKALRDYARIVRAELGSMPAAAVPSTMSPLIAPTPTGEIPGSKAGEFRTMSGGAAAVVSNPAGLGSDAKIANKRVAAAVVPDGPKSAAPERNMGMSGRRGTASTAGGAAGWAAVTERWSKLGDEIKTGPKLRTEDITLGPVKIGRSGLNLRSTEALLGPAAIYGIAIYASLRGAAALGDVTESAMAEAATSGRDFGDVILEKAKNLPGKIVGGIAEGTFGLIFDAAAGAGKFGVGIAALLGLQNENKARGNIDAYTKVFEDMKYEMRHHFSPLTGAKSRFDEWAEGQQELERIKRVAMDAAVLQAEKDAKETAESLLGMGFPGTLDELKSREGPVYRSYMQKYEEDIDKGIREELAKGGKRG